MAIDRYKFTEIKKDDTTKMRFFGDTIFPTIPESEDDVFIVTRIGDRLDLLANRFYQDTTLWWIIALANVEEDVGNGSLFLKPGIRIRIPQNISSILNELGEIQNSR